MKSRVTFSKHDFFNSLLIARQPHFFLDRFRASGFRSLSKILVRIAYSIQPFDFKFVQHGLPPPSLDGIGDRLGKQPGLFDQLDECQVDEFQCVHGCGQGFSQFSTNHSNRLNRRPVDASAFCKSCCGAEAGHALSLDAA